MNRSNDLDTHYMMFGVAFLQKLKYDQISLLPVSYSLSWAGHTILHLQSTTDLWRSLSFIAFGQWFISSTTSETLITLATVFEELKHGADFANGLCCLPAKDFKFYQILAIPRTQLATFRRKRGCPWYYYHCLPRIGNILNIKNLNTLHVKFGNHQRFNKEPAKIVKKLVFERSLRH